MRKILRGIGATIVVMSMFGGFLFMNAHRHGEYVSAIWVLPYAIAVLGSIPFLRWIDALGDKLDLPD